MIVTLLGSLLVLLILFRTSATDAQYRVWESGGEETERTNAETEGDSSPNQDRWLDITSMLQAGWVFRFADEYAGVTDSSPWLRHARIGIAAQLSPWLHARIAVEFAPVASLKSAFLHVEPHSSAMFQLGQFRVPFLRAFQFSEIDLAFLDRPLYIPSSPDRPVIRFLAARDIGVAFRGQVGDIREGGTGIAVQYAAGTFLGRGANVTRNDNESYLYAARVEAHLLGVPYGANSEGDLARNESPRVSLGAGVYSNCDDRANWNRGVTIDTEFRYRGLYASASAVWLRNGSANGSAFGEFLGYGDFCVGAQDNMGEPVDFISNGAHVQLQYTLPPALFSSSTHRLELLGRADYVNPNSPYDPDRPILGGTSSTDGYVAPERLLNSDNAPTQWRLTFGLNWFPTNSPTLRLSANYQHNREAEDIVTPEGTLIGVRNDRLMFQITAGL